MKKNNKHNSAKHTKFFLLSCLLCLTLGFAGTAKAGETMEYADEMIPEMEHAVADEMIPETEYEEINAGIPYKQYVEKKQYGSINSYSDQWLQPEGLLYHGTIDLDLDKIDEYVLIYSSEVPSDNPDIQFGTIIEVYEPNEDGEYVFADSMWVKAFSKFDYIYTKSLLGYNEWYNKYFEISLVDREDSVGIYCGYYAIARIFANEQNYESCLLTYRDGKLMYEASFSHTSSGIDGFEFTGYYFENGEMCREQLLYSDYNMNAAYGNDYSAALSGFYSEFGVDIRLPENAGLMASDSMLDPDKSKVLMQYLVDYDNSNSGAPFDIYFLLNSNAWDYSYRDEKGKTILCVQGDSEIIDSGDSYALTIEYISSDEVKTQLTDCCLTAENNYTVEYDFSTKLGLESGEYRFGVINLADGKEDQAFLTYELYIN